MAKGAFPVMDADGGRGNALRGMATNRQMLPPTGDDSGYDPGRGPRFGVVVRNSRRYIGSHCAISEDSPRDNRMLPAMATASA